MNVSSPRRPWYRRPSRLIPATIFALVGATAIAAVVSPWPSALLIRALFEADAKNTIAEMTPYAPTGGIAEALDVPYGPDGRDTTLDVFTPEAGDEPLPTVVWIHGGAWISGYKEDVRPYVRMIAAEGYTTVALNYTVAPERTYPTAVTQLNEALAFLVAQAAEYRIDPSRIVIAGDSAGANLTTQLALLTTNPAYAADLGLDPALTPEQLRAVVLNCGIYDVSGVPDSPGLAGWGFRMALWSYLGDRDWVHTVGARQMSTIDSMTADFPPAWISGGNGDPLTRSQAQPLAAKLDALGVDVTTLFFPDDLYPELPHEYQFHLDFPEAHEAFRATIEFLDRVTG